VTSSVRPLPARPGTVGGVPRPRPGDHRVHPLHRADLRDQARDPVRPGYVGRHDRAESYCPGRCGLEWATTAARGVAVRRGERSVERRPGGGRSRGRARRPAAGHRSAGHGAGPSPSAPSSHRAQHRPPRGGAAPRPAEAFTTRPAWLGAARSGERGVSDHVTWEFCPLCRLRAAVGWVCADDGIPATHRPVEFDCLSGCRLGLEELAQAYLPAGPRPSEPAERSR
jgi:hypothetical protein